MKNFLKIHDCLDVMPLLLAISRRPSLWKDDTYLRDYPQGPFKEVETIMLRFPVKSVHETEDELKKHVITFDQHESVDYPAYKILPEARTLIMFLMARVGGERLGRCMINKINPKGRIFPHADTPSHAEYYSRYHIVIKSNDSSMFRCDDEVVNMKTGEVWWFNNSLEHEVRNEGDDERIHLIVDIRCSQ